MLRHEATLDIDPALDLICFEISGEGVGRSIVCVSAGSIEAARARMMPLYAGCKLTPVRPEELPAPLAAPAMS